MLPVRLRHGENDGVVADLAVPAAPCRHVGRRIGPADPDAAVVGRLPAVASAAQPVVVVAQGDKADPICMGKRNSLIHRLPCVEWPKSSMSVPAFDCAEGHHALRLYLRVDHALVKIIHHSREADVAVAVNAIQTVVREHSSGVGRVFLREAALDQNTLKLAEHFVIRYLNHCYSTSVFLCAEMQINREPG